MWFCAECRTAYASLQMCMGPIHPCSCSAGGASLLWHTHFWIWRAFQFAFCTQAHVQDTLKNWHVHLYWVKNTAHLGAWYMLLVIHYYVSWSLSKISINVCFLHCKLCMQNANKTSKIKWNCSNQIKILLCVFYDDVVLNVISRVHFRPKLSMWI